MTDRNTTKRLYLADLAELEALGKANAFCPKDCPHKAEEPLVNVNDLKKSKQYPEPSFHSFTTLYWCEKYRSLLGAHCANPMACIFGGEYQVFVTRSPFCLREQETSHDRP